MVLTYKEARAFVKSLEKKFYDVQVALLKKKRRRQKRRTRKYRLYAEHDIETSKYVILKRDTDEGRYTFMSYRDKRQEAKIIVAMGPKRKPKIVEVIRLSRVKLPGKDKRKKIKGA